MGCSNTNYVSSECPWGSVVTGVQSISSHNAWNSCSGTGAGNALQCAQAGYGFVSGDCQTVRFSGHNTGSAGCHVDTCTNSNWVEGMCPSGCGGGDGVDPCPR